MKNSRNIPYFLLQNQIMLTAYLNFRRVFQWHKVSLVMSVSAKIFATRHIISAMDCQATSGLNKSLIHAQTLETFHLMAVLSGNPNLLKQKKS